MVKNIGRSCRIGRPALSSAGLGDYLNGRFDVQGGHALLERRGGNVQKESPKAYSSVRTFRRSWHAAATSRPPRPSAAASGKP